jgi:hypothetical protein
MSALPPLVQHGIILAGSRFFRSMRGLFLPGPRSCGGRDGKRHQGEIDAIVAAYQQRFQQQALGVVIASACAAF